jgi:ABC-type branched-subunit amino acid transport system ATPase component
MAILEIENLVKEFGGLTAIDEITFDLDTDHIYGLIGPNGAGKTTLFNLLTGMLEPTQGEIRFDEESIIEQSSHARSQLGIGRTFQVPNPFLEMTVKENIRVGAYFSESNRSVDELTESAIDLVGFSDIQNTTADSLPIGQLKQLEIARALATDPRLLLLDEPAAGLNPTESQEIIDLLPQLLEEVDTIFLVEHDMDVVMNAAEYIFALNEGRVIADGPPSAVGQDDQVIEAYLGSEMSDDA